MMIMIECPHCRKRVEIGSQSHHDPNGGGQKDSGTSSTFDKISTMMVVGGAAVAVPCVALTAAGFGMAGIGAASVAAAWQSAIGNVAAGSAFAALQSAGATGTLMAGSIFGGTATATGLAAKRLSKNGPTGSEDEEHNEHEDGGGNVDGKRRNTVHSVKCSHCGHEFKLVGLIENTQEEDSSADDPDRQAQ